MTQSVTSELFAGKVAHWPKQLVDLGKAAGIGEVFDLVTRAELGGAQRNW